jgi:hypothetical protein
LDKPESSVKILDAIVCVAQMSASTIFEPTLEGALTPTDHGALHSSGFTDPSSQ